MLGSAANFPLERLARLWLPSIIARDRDDISKIGALAELPEDAPGEFVVAALRQSRAFASLELEGILGEYRHGLLVHFSAAGERGRKKRLFLTRDARPFSDGQRSWFTKTGSGHAQNEPSCVWGKGTQPEHLATLLMMMIDLIQLYIRWSLRR
jgi:hypothetical protein